MAISFLDGADNAGSGTSATASYGIAQVAHQTNVVTICWDNTFPITGNVTDGTNTYHQVFFTSGPQGAISVWMCFDVAAHAAPTVTVNFLSSVAWSIAVDSYSGCATGNPVGSSSATASGTSAAPSVGPVTPPSANNVVIGVCNGANTLTNGGSFALRDQNGIGAQNIAVEDLIQVAATAQTPNFTQTSGAFVALAFVLSDTNSKSDVPPDPQVVNRNCVYRM